MTLKKLLFVISILVFWFIFPNQISAQNLLFSDNFEIGNINDKWRYFSGTWNRETFNESVWARISSVEFKDNEIQSGDSSWTNYSLNLDIFKIEGEDINLFFRIQNSRYLNLSGHDLPISYGLHMKHNRFALQKFTEGSGIELQVTSDDDTSFLNSSLKHINIRLEDNNIKVFVDNSINPILDYTDNNLPFLSGGVAIASITGTAGTNVRFDNITVTQIATATSVPTTTASPSLTPNPTSTPTSTPISSPSPSPTLSPTSIPTPIIPILNVLSLKQYSEPWQNNLYGHTASTIKQWGCALTSASMVLKYHGHNIMPDALNSWLKSQSDGYIKNSLINWLAVSRYTKLHDSISSPTLEYKKLTATEANLDSELNNNRPAILKENGHYVVATGKLFNTYSINDPGYASRNDLISYNNYFLEINSYRPTHSNLSYMMFTADSDIIFELVDSSGNTIDTQKYIENPISSIDDPENKSGDSLSVLLYEKPVSGNYKLKITGNPGSYIIDIYLYNINGDVTKSSISGNLIEENTDIYDIVYESDIPAIISNEISNTPTTNSAIVTWTTNKLANSRVIYDTVKHSVLGITPNYGYAFSTGTSDISPKVTSHFVTINGLSADTTYYYRVISEGSPVAIGDEFSFKTLSIAGAPSSPAISNINPLLLGTATFKKYIVFSTESKPSVDNESKVLGSDEIYNDTKDALGATKIPSKRFDKIDVFLISLASLLVLMIIGIRLLPDTTKKSK